MGRMSFLDKAKELLGKHDDKVDQALNGPIFDVRVFLSAAVGCLAGFAMNLYAETALYF